MNEQDAIHMANRLLTQYGDRGFEISMGDRADYDLMRKTFSALGRESGPDGEFFVVRVPPVGPNPL
jgi:hypothetical protein